jgi:hypothetical protein
MKAGYGKAGKQKTLSNFPTATTTTNYNYLWDTDSEGKVKHLDTSDLLIENALLFSEAYLCIRKSQMNAKSPSHSASIP